MKENAQLEIFSWVIRRQVCGVRTVSSAGPTVLILNQIWKLHSSQFLQTRIQHCLSVLWYFYNSLCETIYSLAVFFASFMLSRIIPTINFVMIINQDDFEWHRIIALLSSNMHATGLAKTKRVIIAESWKTLAILMDIELGNTILAFLMQIKEIIGKKSKRRKWNWETAKWYKNLKKDG